MNINLAIFVSSLVGVVLGLLLGFFIWKQRIPKDIPTYFDHLGNLDLTVKKPLANTFWNRLLESLDKLVQRIRLFVRDTFFAFRNGTSNVHQAQFLLGRLYESCLREHGSSRGNCRQSSKSSCWR